MAENYELVVYQPREGEPLLNYLQRLTDRQLEDILENDALLHEICRILQARYANVQRLEEGLEHLWGIIERRNNLDYIQALIRQVETVRESLLESLAQSEKEIQRNLKFTNLARLTGSAVDIAGTVGGLLMQKSQSGYANLAFKTATTFGILGFFSTLSEMDILKDTLDNLIEKIEHDQEIIAPFRRWYRESDVLDQAMQNLFEIDITSNAIDVFRDASNTVDSQFRLLAALIRSVAEENISHLRDEARIQNLINLTSHQDYQDLCQWIFFRRHPIILDVAKILLQLHSSSPLRFLLTQSIPALSIADQSISSFPVWGRIFLNLLSIHDSLKSLKGSKNPSILQEIRHLRKHLRSELVTLRRIAAFIENRRNRRRKVSSP